MFICATMMFSAPRKGIKLIYFNFIVILFLIMCAFYILFTLYWVQGSDKYYLMWDRRLIGKVGYTMATFYILSFLL